MPGPDYIVDIDGVTTPQASAPTGEGLQGRPWVAVEWKCCNVYSRVYRNREGTAYEGRCPKCMRHAKARVGPGGTNARFFTAE